MNDDDNFTENQKTFYGHLAAELIDNNYDQVGGYARRQQQNNDNNDVNYDLLDPLTGLARSGDGIYLRSTCVDARNDARTAIMYIKDDVQFVN